MGKLWKRKPDYSGTPKIFVRKIAASDLGGLKNLLFHGPVQNAMGQTLF